VEKVTREKILKEYCFLSPFWVAVLGCYLVKSDWERGFSNIKSWLKMASYNPGKRR